jgi:pepF/M3 family oligoendopeptidase
MSHNWNLDDLYLGFTDPKYLSDLKYGDTIKLKYDRLVQDLFKNHQNEVASIEIFLTNLIEDTKLIRKLQAFGHLSFSTNSKSQDALTLKSKVQRISSDMTASNVAFKQWLVKVSDLDVLSEKSPVIAQHMFYLNELKASTTHMLSPEEEILASKLTSTGSLAWETLQSKASSQLMGEVTLDGETKTLPIMSIRNLAFSADAEVRKQGYHAELKAYEKHAEISAAALNGIKGEVLTLSAMRGFESPLHETLFNARMTPEILDAMRTSMEAYLPEFRRYLKLKSKFLGNSGALPFYDLFAPVATVDRDFTIDEAHAFIVKYFANFSEDLANFADHCFKAKWIDFEPAEGKVGGAFCANIPSIKQSRVLLNFTGKLKNVLTIAHELGHAFHGDRIMSESILNTTYPMPLAETASIFCETIVRNAVLDDADDDLKLAILENSLSSATQVIVDILSRYYFETEIFEIRKDHPLSVDEFKNVMISAQKKAYGDGLDPDVLHPYMWLNKTHYYYATRNFYNFPYAFGLLFATGLYSKYLDNPGQFVPAYDEMLRATGKNDIQTVCSLMQIDPTEQDFWNASLEKIKEDVDAFEAIINRKLSI